MKEGQSSRQITLTQPSNTPLSPYTRYQATSTLIFSSCITFTVHPNCIITYHPSPGDNLPEHGRAVQKNTRQCCTHGLCYTQSSTYAPGLYIPSYLLHIVLQPPPTSNQTSTYIHHQHPSRDTVYIHSLYVPKQSQYSLICFSLLPFYTSTQTHLLIPNSIQSGHSK